MLFRSIQDVVFVYSLPDFSLIYTLLPEYTLDTLEVHRDLLIMTLRKYVSSESSLQNHVLHIWDLVSGKRIGVLPEPGLSKPMLSVPEPEKVDLDIEGKLRTEQWPKTPVLVFAVEEEEEADAQTLLVYSLSSPARRPRLGVKKPSQRWEVSQ